MSFDPSHLLAQLSAMDRENGDIKLRCQGDEVKAHTFVLGMRYSIMYYIKCSAGGLEPLVSYSLCTWLQNWI